MIHDERVRTLRDGAATWHDVDGEVVLLDIGRSEYLGLNRSASTLWLALAGGATRGRLIDDLRAAYGLDRDRAAGDVDAFLAVCEQRAFLAAGRA